MKQRHACRSGNAFSRVAPLSSVGPALRLANAISSVLPRSNSISTVLASDPLSTNKHKECRIQIWRKFQYYEENIIYLNSFFSALGFCAILCFPADKFDNR